MLLANILLAASFQIGPFYQQKGSDFAVRPFYAQEGGTADVLWPVFTSHDDWWRFLFFTHYQTNDKGYQFEVMPLFWWGRGETVEGARESYGGLFPIVGHHPHFAYIYDIDFLIWPLWMRYKMPRPDAQVWMETNSVLFPFIHWRSDGSWGFWPLYICNQQRESYHRAVAWPILTWANYSPDRDTAGSGSSWMLWPLFGGISREREDQWLFLPPFFSYAKTYRRGKLNTGCDLRIRAPWPFVEYEKNVRRERLSAFPFYERVNLMTYSKGVSSSVTRFGYRLVEIYDDEVRVFPFWVSRGDGKYFRLWPFWDSEVGDDGVRRGRFLSLFPIRHVPSVDRNWSKFWTLYENAEFSDHTEHALLWGIIRWTTEK